MPTGFLSHLDMSVGFPARSIPFYEALLTTLGYLRWREPDDAWQEPNPTRAAWGVAYPDGTTFGIDLRPARADSRDRKYDRFEPGPHHVAFQAADRATVDRVHRAMGALGAEVLDAPMDYGGQVGYGDSYYAVFFADPDNVKLEVVSVAPADAQGVERDQ